jgi:DNA-binding transcriptional ArsR family regulator
MRHSLTSPMIDEVSSLFDTLGDTSRLKVLRALLDSRSPLSQGAVAKASGLTQANASKHLARLVRVGLASRVQAGNSVYFSLVMPLVGDLCDLVCGHVSRRARTSYQALR